MAVTQDTINKAKELNKQYKAGEISADEVRNQMADAYYARDPAKLQNADVNVSKYGDDHSPENYNNPEMWGGENQKYTGENTKNSYTAYDPNATTEGLNPNYQYGRNAQMANSEQANYIANRNDQIASALYNEGKTSIQDVRNFLEGQRGFFNSNENERENTINSVWKRLGQIASENGNKDTDNSKGPTDQNNDQALQNMQDDLMKDTSGKLYGKVTADETEYGNAINTVADPYNVDRMMAESRVANVKKLQTMDSQSIAASIISGTTPYGEQAMRDLMQYNPQKYEEIQTAIKQLKGQKTINSITSGEKIETYTSGERNVLNDMDSFAENYSNVNSLSNILKDVKDTLASNDVANTAQEQMATIENDMTQLQNRLKNLKKEASQVFKGDVPQYIVSAYVANRTAEIQDQLQVLENRYNAAYNRYQTEREQTKRKAEFSLKQQQLQLQQEQFNVSKYATEQGILIDWAKLGANTTSTLSYDQSIQVLQNFAEEYKNGTYGGQCGAFVKKYLSQLGINLPNISALNAKTSLINTEEGYQPSEGDVVIMNSTNHPENGHMAIVESVDDDGTIHILESNWNGDEQVHRRTIKPGDKQILGYYNPYQQSNTQGMAEGGYYNPNYADLYSKLLQGQFYTEGRLKTALQTVGLDNVEEFTAQAEARKAAQKSDREAIERLEAIEYLLKDDRGRWGRMAASQGRTNWATEGLSDYGAYYKYIKDNITFDKLLDLKKNGATFGALSDNELEAIGNAASSLNTKMSQSEFENRLLNIYNSLLAGIGETPKTLEEVKGNGGLYEPLPDTPLPDIEGGDENDDWWQSSI